MNKLETLKTWVQESNRIVFFGGAGVSTECATKSTIRVRLNPGLNPGYLSPVYIDLLYDGSPQAALIFFIQRFVG